MKKKSLILLSLILVLSILLTACGGEKAPVTGDSGEQGNSSNGETPPADAIVVKLGHQAPSGTAYDVLANKFKELVEEKTNGKYKIEIFGGAQLGQGRELMEALQVGNVEFSVLTAADMGMFVPEMEVQDLPYLFKNWDEVYKFLDSDAAKDFYKLSDEADIKTLSFMPRGFRHSTNNKKPLEKPEDFKGLKIRVAENSIYIDTFTAFGASPQSMAWGEVFTALQQGTVDGHENTIITIRDYKINEVQKYLSKTGHMFAFGAIATSPEWFNGLPEEDQKLIEEAALEAGKVIGKLQEEEESEVAEELESLGMEFNEVDVQAFADLMDPVYDNFFKTHDRKYFDAIRKAVE